MTTAATLEALDVSVIRNILRSMINEHWSVTEALDEYDVPESLRDEYEALRRGNEHRRFRIFRYRKGF